MQHVKSEVVKNPLVSTQQLYEIVRENQVANRTDIPVTMSYYTSIKDFLIRNRGKTQHNTQTLRSKIR